MINKPIASLSNLHVLAKFGDSITTDHISPAGNIPLKSPAGDYLSSRGLAYKDFNSFGSRRGNDKVMTRGTFANIRIKNQLVAPLEGGYSLFNNETLPIYEVAKKTSSEVGRISFKYTFSPSRLVPRATVVKFLRTEPAKAYATTNGGLAR